MKTSYFNVYFASDGVSVARFSPKWFKGEEYKALAPPAWLLNRYRMGLIGETEYEVIYDDFVLSKLSPSQVYEDLKDKVLLCYEPTGFCHRFLVSKWIETELGIHVPEV